MPQKLTPLNYALGLVGGAIGGAVGYFAFDWILSQGLYAMVLPGSLLGIGCGVLSGGRSIILVDAVCGVAGLWLGIFAEWRTFPFIANDGFGYFVKHVADVMPMHLLMIGLGGIAAFWFGMGRGEGVWKRKAEKSPQRSQRDTEKE